MALLPLALAAAAGAVVTKLWDRFQASRVASVMSPLPGGNPQAQVTVLQPGRAYSADMLVDPSGFPTKDPQNNAQPIADALGQVGMVLLVPPQPRDPTNDAAFKNGQPARMFTVFRWTGQAGAPGALPGFIQKINFYDVPAAL